MKKRIMIIGLVVCAVLALAGCRKKKGNQPTQQAIQATTQEQKGTENPANTQAPKETESSAQSQKETTTQAPKETESSAHTQAPKETEGFADAQTPTQVSTEPTASADPEAAAAAIGRIVGIWHCEKETYDTWGHPAYYIEMNENGAFTMKLETPDGLLTSGTGTVSYIYGNEYQVNGADNFTLENNGDEYINYFFKVAGIELIFRRGEYPADMPTVSVSSSGTAENLSPEEIEAGLNMVAGDWTADNIIMVLYLHIEADGKYSLKIEGIDGTTNSLSGTINYLGDNTYRSDNGDKCVLAQNNGADVLEYYNYMLGANVIFGR